MANSLEVLLVTKGHSFEREPFFRLIDRLSRATSVRWTHVEQPAAQSVLTVEGAAGFDAIVFYDMPGVEFTRRNPPFSLYEPTEKHRQDFLELARAGKGLVFLHHAIAGWPTWPEYAEIVGGRFHFLPGTLGSQEYPGSGYRFRTAQTIDVVDDQHPIVAGIPSQFELVDEAYLYPVLEDRVQPLLVSDFDFSAEQFPYGGVNFREHPRGTSLVGWTNAYGKSPVVYLQPGHGPEAYENEFYERLLSNSIRWVASEQAHAWAEAVRHERSGAGASAGDRDPAPTVTQR